MLKDICTEDLNLKNKEEENESLGKPLKYYDVAVTFAEFPDEITLCVNITGCVCHCSQCSEPWLRPYVGTLLTNEAIDKLIEDNPGITVFGLMGGDSDHKDVVRIAKYIHGKYPELKVGMYSGREFLGMELLENLDLYKIGRWIMPKGPVEEWHQTNNGVLQFPWSNQLLFEKKEINGELVWMNVTHKFRKEKVGNPARFIITAEDNKD